MIITVGTAPPIPLGPFVQSDGVTPITSGTPTINVLVNGVKQTSNIGTASAVNASGYSIYTPSGLADTGAACELEIDAVVGASLRYLRKDQVTNQLAQSSVFGAAAGKQAAYGLTATGGVTAQFSPWTIDPSSGLPTFFSALGTYIINNGTNWTLISGGHTWTGSTVSNPPAGTYSNGVQADVTLTAISAQDFESAPPATPATGSRDALLVAASAGSGGGGNPNTI